MTEGPVLISDDLELRNNGQLLVYYHLRSGLLLDRDRMVRNLTEFLNFFF